MSLMTGVTASYLKCRKLKTIIGGFWKRGYLHGSLPMRIY
jgi:hypothetical protein